MSFIFEWDLPKESENIKKHGYSFGEAMQVFADPHVIHLEDPKHSSSENRFFAVGKTKNGDVLTVRFTWRDKTIRIFGVAKWRKWRTFYEQNTKPKHNEKN